MARPLRVEFPGALNHITARGNARANIFCDDEDRTSFFTVLANVVGRWNWICHAYCLMSNHYHLLIETPEGNLSQGMRQLNGVVTQRFNRRHNRTGHLFQGRFKSIIVDKEPYLLELCRYIVLNPVRAGMVDDPSQHKWSSFRATAGLDTSQEFLSTDWILGQFGESRSKAQAEYQRFVRAGSDVKSPWQELKGQCVLGGKDFLEKLLPFLKDKSGLKEIPRVQRYVHRPSLDEILPPTLSRQDRNRAITTAHLEHGYTQQHIASHTGLHYSTISRIIDRARKGKISKNKTCLILLHNI